MITARPAAAHAADSAREKPLLRGVSHEIAAFVALAAWIGLTVAASPGRARAAAAVYGATLLALFTVSALYHRPTWAPRARLFWRRLDHSAIFLLIAGTYTPFALVSLRGPWGWSVLGVIWGCAVVGILLRTTLGARWQVAQVILYVAMGWAGLVAFRPMTAAVPAAGLALVVLGGLAYTVGIAFYGWRRLPYHHAVWHLFVLAGSALHYFAVLLYVVPRGT